MTFPQILEILTRIKAMVVEKRAMLLNSLQWESSGGSRECRQHHTVTWLRVNIYALCV